VPSQVIGNSPVTSPPFRSQSAAAPLKLENGPSCHAVVGTPFRSQSASAPLKLAVALWHLIDDISFRGCNAAAPLKFRLIYVCLRGAVESLSKAELPRPHRSKTSVLGKT
jgi:hypothetical protein